MFLFSTTPTINYLIKLIATLAKLSSSLVEDEKKVSGWVKRE